MTTYTSNDNGRQGKIGNDSKNYRLSSQLEVSENQGTGKGCALVVFLIGIASGLVYFISTLN